MAEEDPACYMERDEHRSSSDTQERAKSLHSHVTQRVNKLLLFY